MTIQDYLTKYSDEAIRKSSVTPDRLQIAMQRDGLALIAAGLEDFNGMVRSITAQVKAVLPSIMQSMLDKAAHLKAKEESAPPV